MKNDYGDRMLTSIDTSESTRGQTDAYKDIEISEKQIESGTVKDAGTALGEIRAKYGL